MKGFLKLSSILISVLIANAVLLVIVPSFPIVAFRRGISQTEISIVFATSQLSSFICSFKVSRIISCIGNRYTAILGLLANSLSMLGISLASYLDNQLFLYISIGSRIVGGFGLACIYISSFGLIQSEFPESSERYISLMEAFGGIGLILAPLYCTLVYDLIGFSEQLLYVCIVVLVFTLMYWLGTKPGSDSKAGKLSDECGLVMKFTRNLTIDYSMLVYGYIIFCYLQATLGLYLLENGVDEEMIGISFTGMTFFYTLTLFFLSWLGKHIRLERLISLGVLTSTTVLILAGPIASLFNLNWLILISVIFFGTGLGIGFSCTMPAMIKEINSSKFDNKDRLFELNSIYSMGLNTGEVLGPVISSVLSERLGFVLSSIFIIFIGLLILFSHFCLRKQKQPHIEPLLDVNKIKEY